MDNPGNNLLRGGMHAKAIFQFTDQRKGLVIPRKAIIGSVQDAKVYVVRDSTAQLRAVQIGSLQSDRAEVISGLNAGEEIVLTGQLNLSNGSKVAVLKEQ